MAVKQIAGDTIKSGTVRLNTLIPLIVAVLPQFGVVATPEMIALGTALANIGWKIIQKSLKHAKSKV